MHTKKLASLALAAVAAGCGKDPVVPEYSSSSGSLALAPGDKIAFAADADNGALVVVDLEAGAVAANVPVGPRAQFVVAGKDGSAWVSVRGARKVVRVARGGEGWAVGGE